MRDPKHDKTSAPPAAPQPNSSLSSPSPKIYRSQPRKLDNTIPAGTEVARPSVRMSTDRTMAYVVVSFRDQEILRQSLGRSVVIGRAPECDIVIRDILLSRRHCRIEKDGSNWFLSDLGSKNGTRI